MTPRDPAPTLYLVRHAIAENAGADTRDADRALTRRGAARMRRAARGLKRLGIKPDVILSSPLRRAAETAALIAGALAPNLTVEPYDALAPGHDPAEIARGLERHRTARHIVLVGHEPGISEFASYLLSGGTELPLPFKKGAVAAIRAASLAPRPEGQMLWFLTPKQLRLLGS